MKHFKQSKPGKNSKGFYVALGLCLMAVGVASWVTFDSVNNFTAGDPSSSETLQTEKNVSGVKVPSSSSSSSKTESSSPESSAVSESPSPQESSAPADPVSSEPDSSEEPPAVSAGTAPESSAPSVPTPDALQYPLGSSVSKGYSGESLLYSETMKDWRSHTGVDISGKAGDTVKASAAGTVKSVSSESIYGVTVVIDHGELTASYCGLGTTSVKEGDSVSIGQGIGTLGEVPCEAADGVHLHFEVSRSGKLLDPEELLQ